MFGPVAVNYAGGQRWLVDVAKEDEDISYQLSLLGSWYCLFSQGCHSRFGSVKATLKGTIVLLPTHMRSSAHRVFRTIAANN